MVRRLSRDRRAISTIVGTIIFIAVFAAGFNVITWGLQVYDNYAQTVAEKALADKEMLMEEFELSSAAIVSNKFNLTVTNTGPVTVRLVRLWVTNETASSPWHEYFDMNIYVNPGEKVTNIGQNLPLTANAGNTYVLKLIAERGNSVSTRLLRVADSNLILTLEVSPPTPIPDTRVNVFFGVTNNETDSATVYDLVPQLVVTGNGTATLVSGPTPSLRSSLQTGSTTFFQWEYDVSGADGSVVTFNATLTGAKQGSYVLENITLMQVKFAQQSDVSSESLTTEAGGAKDNKLYWHDQAELDGKQQDPLRPEGGSDAVTTLSSSSTTIRFYTKPLNASDINIPAGDWKLKIFYKTVGSGSSTVRVIYEEVNADGTQVIGTIEDFSWTLPNRNNVGKEETTWSESAVTISAGNRMRLTMIWQSGQDVELHYDSKNRDTHTKFEDDDPQPNFPVYSIYSGGDLWVTMKNTGNYTFFVTFNSRAVFKQINSNDTYAGFIVGWEEESGPPETAIDSTHDSRAIPPEDTIRLHFSTPTTVPSKNADKGTPIPSGSYTVNVFINGYDALGRAVFLIITVGTVTF